MAYTNVWSDSVPTGAEAANSIDDIFRSLKVDINQRISDIFSIPDFTIDPLRPYGIKLGDDSDSVISLGDNAGTPRSLIVKNKANSATYLTINSTASTFNNNVIIQGSISNHGLKQLYTDALTTDSFDIYHYADQTNPANQTRALAIHNYTDAVTLTIDTVGSNTTLIVRQAHNSSQRPDKPADYVGTGVFFDVQRTVLVGGGNLGNGNDRLAMFDANGNLAFYRDFNGTSNVAPVQIGTYTHFLQRMLYAGYDDANNKAIIGSIDLDASVLRPIDLMTSQLTVSGSLIASAGLIVTTGNTTLNTTSVNGDNVSLRIAPVTLNQKAGIEFTNPSNTTEIGYVGFFNGTTASGTNSHLYLTAIYGEIVVDALNIIANTNNAIDIGIVGNAFRNLFLTGSINANNIILANATGVIGTTSLGVTGLLVLSGADDYVRIGDCQNKFNGVFLTSAGIDKWQLTNAGNLLPVIDSTYNLGSAANQILNLYSVNTISNSFQIGAAGGLTRTGNYTIIGDSAGVSIFQGGNTTAANNLYDNTSHLFRTRSGASNLATINNSGLLLSVGNVNIPSASYYQINSVNCFGGDANGTYIKDQAGNLTITAKNGIASAPGFNTVTGIVNGVTSGTATTVYTVTDKGLYFVYCSVDGASSSTYGAEALIGYDGVNLARLQSGGNITVSGSNIQYTQTNGTTVNVTYRILRIA